MTNQFCNSKHANQFETVPPKIKILHLLSSRGLYGAERVLVNLIEHYNTQIITPYMALLQDSKAPADDLIEAADRRGAQNIIIKCGKWVDIKALKQVNEIIKNEGIHIIHCNEMKSRLYGLIVSKMLHIPVITTHHNWIRNKLSTTIFEYLDAVYIRFIDRVIPVSVGVKKALREIAVPKRRMSVILNGINVREFVKDKRRADSLREELNIGNSEYVVGSVGRLSVEKGHRYFLEAAHKVLTKMQNIRFVIVGDGELTDELRELVQKLEIEQNIIFAGYQTDVTQFYSLMDICVMPSLIEGTPMALMEAMATGVPVIASAVGGIPTIIDNRENGVLVEPQNPDAITNAILALLQNRTACDKISKNARKTILKRYSADRMARQYENEYRRLLIRKNGRCIEPNHFTNGE